MRKKLILVASPPACGKTYVSERIAKAVGHIVYLDKDDLSDLLRAAFAVSAQAVDAANAHRYGADFVKLFPNSEVNISYLKALAVPLSHIKFLAVGGVNHENMQDYFGSGAKGIGVATAIADKTAIISENYEEITRRAKLFTDQTF